MTRFQFFFLFFFCNCDSVCGLNIIFSILYAHLCIRVFDNKTTEEIKKHSFIQKNNKLHFNGGKMIVLIFNAIRKCEHFQMNQLYKSLACDFFSFLKK